MKRLLKHHTHIMASLFLLFNWAMKIYAQIITVNFINDNTTNFPNPSKF